MLYLNMTKDDVPTILLKNENLRGAKKEGDNIWLFYINGKDDITVAIWDKNIKTIKSMIRNNLMSLEVMLYDVLGYDDFFKIFKDALPYEL